MMKEKEHWREAQYRPQSAKTLRVALKSFIRREFPRLGGPWVIDKFVDRLLEIVDQYRFYHGKLTPGQVVWPAVRIDDPPVYRKPIASTHQIPVIITIVNQDDIAALRNDADCQFADVSTPEIRGNSAPTIYGNTAPPGGGVQMKKAATKKHDQKVIIPREPANGAKAKRFDLREHSPEAGAQSRAVEVLAKRLAVPPLMGWPQGRELPAKSGSTGIVFGSLG